MQQRRQEELQEPRPPRTRPRLAPFETDCYKPDCNKVAIRFYPRRASVRAKLSPRHYHTRECQLKDWRERRRLRRMALRHPHPCASCGTLIEPEHRPGRPRTYCRQCSDRRRRSRPRPATVRKAQAELDGLLSRADAVARTAREAHRSLEAAEAMAQRARAALEQLEASHRRMADLTWRRLGSAPAVSPELQRDIRQHRAALQGADDTALARRAEAERHDGLADVAMDLVRRAQGKLHKAEERAAKNAKRERQRRADAKAKRPPPQPRPKPPTTYLPQAEQFNRERAKSDPEYREYALRRGLL